MSAGPWAEWAVRSPYLVLLASWLVPVTPPMRMPDGMWAFMITKLDIHCCRGHAEGVDWFSGIWLADGAPPDRYVDGNVVLRLFELLGTRSEPTTPSRVDVDMLLRCRNGWRRVGLWLAQGNDWPQVVAYTADAIMDLALGITDAQ